MCSQKRCWPEGWTWTTARGVCSRRPLCRNRKDAHNVPPTREHTRAWWRAPQAPRLPLRCPIRNRKIPGRRLARSALPRTCITGPLVTAAPSAMLLNFSLASLPAAAAPAGSRPAEGGRACGPAALVQVDRKFLSAGRRASCSAGRWHRLLAGSARKAGSGRCPPLPAQCTRAPGPFCGACGQCHAVQKQPQRRKQ